jgi:probable F420-dependent oxidoreductase
MVLVSVGLPVDRAGDPRLLRADGIGEVARAAERAGFAAVFCTDHPAPDADWLATGGHPTVDPFVALSVAAAATTTLRLHTNLLVLGYRNPLLAAKAIATLDVVSGGRSIVGVGVGYLAAEFAALGADFAGRGPLADEALAAMVEAWRAEPLDLDGTGWRARQTVVAPAPLQRPHPPLWVGGNSSAAMARAVRFGAGWAPMPSPRGSESALGTPAMPDLAAFATGVERLHELAASAGRVEPLEVVAIPPSLSGFGGPRWRPERALEEMALLTDAGATGFVVNLPGGSVAGSVEELEAFGETVLHRLPR